MKTKHARALFALVAAICLIGAMAWGNAGPAILENDALVPEVTDGDMFFIPDDEVPLSELPQLPEATEGAEAVEEPVDPYEGLDKTQIKYVDEVVALVNEARAAAGLPALTLDPNLRKAAQVRAAECVGLFSHTRPDGTLYKTAIKEAGVVSGYTGENVASGYTTAKHVMQGWMNSPGHKANILNENFTKIGVGLQKNVGNGFRGYAWSQEFVK